jgi:putative restriction endonuclease
MTLRGYVGTTDFLWYQFLFSQQEASRSNGETGLDEVNFWQPNAKVNFNAVKPGAPFFFKLKAPHNAIAGYGVYVRQARIPAWLAWESFEKMNGASTKAEMLGAISRYRKDPTVDRAGQYEIGCLLIAQPRFFSKPEWIRQPADWSAPIVQGKSYDLISGEGKRIYEECLSRTSPLSNPFAPAEPFAQAPHGERYGEPTLIRPRLGQGIFRVLVTKAYDGACCVSTEHSLPVLEAAHVRPYGEGGIHEVSNGLLLRSDIHKLFDCGYVTVTPDYHFEVSPRLKSDFSNGKSYYAFHGQKITLPDDPAGLPDRSILSWHNEVKFLAR